MRRATLAGDVASSATSVRHVTVSQANVHQLAKTTDGASGVCCVSSVFVYTCDNDVKTLMRQGHVACVTVESSSDGTGESGE